MPIYKIQVKDNVSCNEQEIQKVLNKKFGKNSFIVEKENIDSSQFIEASPNKENKNKIQPEINDIIESIRRYLAVNQSVCFVGSFTSLECKCADCSKSGEDEINIKDDASAVFAFGDLQFLREELNCLRDLIEDEADEDGFVSI